MIETNRLKIYVASREQMESFIAVQSHIRGMVTQRKWYLQ